MNLSFNCEHSDMKKIKSRLRLGNNKNQEILFCFDVSRSVNKLIGFICESLKYFYYKSKNNCYGFKLVFLLFFINSTFCSDNINPRKRKHDDVEKNQINVGNYTKHNFLEMYDLDDFSKKKDGKILSDIKKLCYYIGRYATINDYKNKELVDGINSLTMEYLNQNYEDIKTLKFEHEARFADFKNKINTNKLYLLSPDKEFFTDIKFKKKYCNNFLLEYFKQNFKYEYDNSSLCYIIDFYFKHQEKPISMCSCNQEEINDIIGANSDDIFKERLIFWLYLSCSELKICEMPYFYVGRTDMNEKLCVNYTIDDLNKYINFVHVQNFNKNIFLYQDIISKKYKFGIINMTSEKQFFKYLVHEYTIEKQNIYSAIYIKICLYITSQNQFKSDIYEVSKVFYNFYSQYITKKTKRNYINKLFFLYEIIFLNNQLIREIWEYDFRKDLNDFAKDDFASDRWFYVMKYRFKSKKKIFMSFCSSIEECLNYNNILTKLMQFKYTVYSTDDKFLTERNEALHDHEIDQIPILFSIERSDKAKIKLRNLYCELFYKHLYDIILLDQEYDIKTQYLYIIYNLINYRCDVNFIDLLTRSHSNLNDENLIKLQ